MKVTLSYASPINIADTVQRITTAVDMIANAADPDMPSWPNPSLKWIWKRWGRE